MKSSRLLFLFLLLSFISTASLAQKGQAAQETDIEDLLAIKLKADYSTLNAVNLNRGGGYDLKLAKLELGNFLAKVSYENFAVDWRQFSKLPFGNSQTQPLTVLHRYKFKANLPFRLDKNRLFLAHLGAELGYEKQSDDALSLQAYGLYSEKLDSLRSWQLGLYINNHPVETVVLPIVEYTYNFNAQIHQGYYGHLGFPKTQIGYHFTPKLRSQLGAVYHQAIMQLSDDSVVESSGYFQSKNWRADWSTYYQISKSFEMKLYLQASLSNKMVLYNHAYKEQDHFYAEGGFGGGIGLVYKFF